MKSEEQAIYDRALRIRNAVFSLDYFDIEQLFINRDLKDLENEEITIKDVVMHISGSCNQKDVEWFNGDGSDGETPITGTEMSGFDITGVTSEEADNVKFSFVDYDKKPKII